MSLQYENVFRSGNKYIERLKDTETNEIIFRDYQVPYEVYTKTHDDSPYRFVLDQTIKLKKNEFKNNSDLNSFIKTCELTNQKVYGKSNPINTHIRDHYFFNNEPFQSRIWHLDIEAIPKKGEGFPDPTEAKYEINTFQIYDRTEDKVIIILSKDLTIEFQEEMKAKYECEIDFFICKNEIVMFEKFFVLLEHYKPAIIDAWNGEGFDFPYVTNRAKNLLGVNHLRLSPVRNVGFKKINSMNGPMEKAQWFGITLVDTMQAYKNFTFVTQVSYSLDNIASVELGEGSGKVDYGEFTNIIDFYHGDHDKFIDYAIKDVIILRDLESKLNLLEVIRMLSYLMGIVYDDAMGTVKPWGTYLTNDSYKDNLIMPMDVKHEIQDSIIGGYVKQPEVGLHKFVMSIDYNSLYPSKLDSQNMSIETYIPPEELPNELKVFYAKYMIDQNEKKFLDKDIQNEIKTLTKKYKVSFGTNAFFSNDKKGIIPTIVTDIYADRKIAKLKMLKYNVMITQINNMMLKNPPINGNDFVYDLNLIENNIADFDELNAIDLEGISESELLRVKDHCETKSAYWDTNQMVKKININSLYGALGNAHFVGFNNSIASSITGTGRLIIRMTGEYIEGKLNELLGHSDKPRWVYTDTDSCYFELNDLKTKLCDSLYQKDYDDLTYDEKSIILEKVTNFNDKYLDVWVNDTVAKYMDFSNSYDSIILGAKLEKIADKGLFVAKKKYSLRVIYDEGNILLENPKVKTTGLEIIRSSTPAFCKTKLSSGMGNIFEHNESYMQDFFKEVRNEFSKQPIDNISKVSGISSLDYSYDARGYFRINPETGKRVPCPINSRAAITHNDVVTKLGLSDYPLISTSDKIKYCYLVLPNPCQSNVVGFIDSKFMKDSGLEEYIDYDMCFEKYFIKPLEIMLDAIGWEAVKANNIDDWL